MSNLIPNNLVNRKFVASIAEPWDFISSIGNNKFEGQVLSVVVPAKGHPVLLCSVSPFKHREVVISRVAAVSRESRSYDVLGTLRAEQAVTITFVFLRSGAQLTEETVLAALIAQGKTGVLFGSMTLSST